jgi:hypothetical protein
MRFLTLLVLFNLLAPLEPCEYRSIIDLQLGGNLVSFQADRNKEFGSWWYNSY